MKVWIRTCFFCTFKDKSIEKGYLNYNRIKEINYFKLFVPFTLFYYLVFIALIYSFSFDTLCFYIVVGSTIIDSLLSCFGFTIRKLKNVLGDIKVILIILNEICFIFLNYKNVNDGFPVTIARHIYILYTVSFIIIYFTFKSF